MRSSLLLIVSALLAITGCIKSDNDQFWNMVTRKGGEWRVDRMIVYRLSLNNVLQSVFTVEKPGSFYFTDENKGEDKYMRFDGAVLIDSFYNIYYKSLKQPLSNLGTSFITSSDGSGTGDGSNMYFVSFVSKDKLNFYTPHDQNYYNSQGSNFSIYFECSRP